MNKNFKEELLNKYFGAYNKDLDKYLGIKEYVALLEREVAEIRKLNEDKEDQYHGYDLEKAFGSDTDYEPIEKSDFENIYLISLDNYFQELIKNTDSIFDYGKMHVEDSKSFVFHNLNVEFDILEEDEDREYTSVKVTSISKI